MSGTIAGGGVLLGVGEAGATVGGRLVSVGKTAGVSVATGRGVAVATGTEVAVAGGLVGVTGRGVAVLVGGGWVGAAVAVADNFWSDWSGVVYPVTMLTRVASSAPT